MGRNAGTECEPSADAIPPFPTRSFQQDGMLEDDSRHRSHFDNIGNPSTSADDDEETRDKANSASNDFPGLSQLWAIDLDNWNEQMPPEFNPDIHEEDLEENNNWDEEQVDNNDPICPQEPNEDEPLPQATYPVLMLAQKLIYSINNATLEDDIRDPKLLHSICQESSITQ